MRISDWSSDVCSSDLSLRRQALHQCRDHIGLVDHGHDSLRSTHGFKRGYGILFAVINVDVGTQRQGVRRNITASSNGNHLETHVPRVLQRHMPQAANTQDGHRIAGLGTALFERVERRDSGAKYRRGFFSSEEQTSELQSLMRISYAV